MPNQISPEKAKAIAQEYCSNNFKKGKAMAVNGYAKSCLHGGHAMDVVYDNVLVKAEIAKIQAKTAKDNEITQFEVVNNARLQVEIGVTDRDANAIRGGNDQLAKVGGHFEKDNLQKQQGIVIMIAPPAGHIEPQQADTGPKQVESEVMGNG